MKIGAFAKKYDSSISTVRHYMKLGLLLPEKKGGQYAFSDNDCREMALILELKTCGFQLRELQKYVNIIRLYDFKDDALHHKLHDILTQKYHSMELEKQQLEHHMSFVAKKIQEAENRCNKDQLMSPFRERDSHQTMPGVPLEFIPSMKCPFCQNTLTLENAMIHGTEILNGSLRCTCGYESLIKNGIIFTGDITYVDEDPEFSSSYYGGDPLLQDFDSLLFECIDTSSTQFLTVMHKARVWLHETLTSQGEPYSCILVPDISTHFLYGSYTADYLKNSLILVTALTEQSILPMKQHLSSLNSDLKIVYLVNQDGNLPLKHGSVDLLIDFFGMCNLSFFNKTHHLDLVDCYLKPAASIAGTMNYYAAGAKSLKNIQKLYRNALPDNLKLTTLKKALADHDFEIKYSEITCDNFTPGEYFEYHEPGETHGNFVFFAKRQPK